MSTYIFSWLKYSSFIAVIIAVIIWLKYNSCVVWSCISCFLACTSFSYKGFSVFQTHTHTYTHTCTQTHIFKGDEILHYTKNFLANFIFAVYENIPSCSFKYFESSSLLKKSLLTLSLHVTRCAGHNTDLASNSNISKRA